MNITSLTPRAANMEQVVLNRRERGGSCCIPPSDLSAVLTGNESTATWGTCRTVQHKNTIRGPQRRGKARQADQASKTSQNNLLMYSCNRVKSAAQTGQEVKELSSCRRGLGSRPTRAHSQFPGMTLQVLLLLLPQQSLFPHVGAAKAHGFDVGELLPVLNDAEGLDEVPTTDDGG